MQKYQELEKLIESKTVPQHFSAMKEALESMLTEKEALLSIEDDLLIEALSLNGEYRLLELTYKDLEYEIKTRALKYILKEALFIITSFEDDGTHYETVKKFSEYLYDNTVEQQYFRIGVKEVEKPSAFPIKILFSGILPINQLRMYIGSELDSLIHSDENYFQVLFAQARVKISDTIGVALLPLYPEVDTNLASFGVKLIDPMTKRIVAQFEIAPQHTDKKGIEIYLLKLFYVYQQLAQDIKESKSWLN